MAATDKTSIVPPQNLEAEESVLGAMMVSEATIEPVILEVHLQAEDFYRDRHRTIFEAIIRLNEAANPVDALTVSEALSQHGNLEAIGGRDVVASLAAKVPAPGSARHYAQIVKQNALMRRLDGAAKRIQQSVAERDGEPTELVEQAERLLFQVAHQERAADFRELSEILHEEIDKLEALSKGTADATGTLSGFRQLDQITGGFQSGNLIVIAARPAMGKSSIVCDIAENVALKHKKPVALFSLEMSEMELAHRFISSQARIQGDKLRKGKVASKDWPKVVKACNTLESAPLWIDDSSDLGMLELRAKARRLHAQERSRGFDGLGMVIVDYLQLMRAEDARGQPGRAGRPVQPGPEDPRAGARRPGDRDLAALPRAGAAARQAANPLRPERKRKSSSRTRMWSGFLYRDEYYNPESEEPGVAELIIAKHRNGPIGRVKLAFLAHYPKFADLAREEQPVQQAAGEGPPITGFAEEG